MDMHIYLLRFVQFLLRLLHVEQVEDIYFQVFGSDIDKTSLVLKYHQF